MEDEFDVWDRYQASLRDMPPTLTEYQKIIFRAGAIAVYRDEIDAVRSPDACYSPEEMAAREPPTDPRAGRPITGPFGAVRKDDK